MDINNQLEKGKSIEKINTISKPHFPMSDGLISNASGVITQSSLPIIRASALSVIAKSVAASGKDASNILPIINKSIENDAPKFVPLATSIDTKNAATRQENAPSCTATKAVSSLDSSKSFVFGQNIESRVTKSLNENSTPTQESNPTASSASIVPIITEPTSLISIGCGDNISMLFMDAMKTDITRQSLNYGTKSLMESAREYEELRSNKRKFDEVEVRTGEEDETNVIQISCKLFSFHDGAWQERGRGILRLNDGTVDDENETYVQSRLVFRTSGSLRVILNTKIWSDMDVEKASQKSIRITAIDNNGGVKVFLIMGTPDDAYLLHKSLIERINADSERQKRRISKIKMLKSTNELCT